MAISLKDLKKGATNLPPRIMIYGVGGVGKTRLASEAPGAVFIKTEDGEGALDITSFPLAKTYADVMEALGCLYTEDHGFRYLVVDSADWLEPIIWAETCARNGWANIETPGYGKGYAAALDIWREYLEGLAALRNERGMGIIQIAHTNIKRFENPETEPYDRYVIKLNDKAAGLLHEHCDAVLFMQYRVSTVKSDIGFNKKAVRAVGGNSRILYTGERPAFLAKNRYNMPDTIELQQDAPMWPELAKYLPQQHAPAQDAA